MDREQLLETIAQARARKATLGVFDDGIDEFEPAERSRANRLDDAALAKELAVAFKDWKSIEYAIRRFRILREEFADRHLQLNAQIGETTTAVQRAIPTVLKDAIERMGAQIESRRQLGLTQVMFGQIPGGSAFMSAKNRTPEHEASTLRAEQALGKLHKLTAQPGDLRKAIGLIEDELHAADRAAADAEPLPRPATRRYPRAEAAHVGQAVGAQIVAD